MPPAARAAPSAMRELVDLAAPVIGLNVLNVTATLVDTVMVGHLQEGETALTALGFAGQITFMMIVASMGLTVGTVALIARAHGGGDRARVDHLLHQSVQLTVLLGVVAGALGYAAMRPILRVLSAPPHVLEAAVSYLAPLMVGTVVVYLVILYGAALRGVGNTRLAFWVSLVINGCNVVFNAALIFGAGPLPPLGLEGAAYGTLAAHVIGLGLTLWLLRRGAEPSLTPRLRWEKIDRPLAAEVLRVGAPAALDVSILNFSLFVIIGLLSRVDPLAVAAHGIGLRVQSLAFVPGLSISQATGALVGQSLGAANLGRVREIVRASGALACGVLSLLGVLLMLFATPLLRAFGAEPGTPLEELSRMWMLLLAAGMPLVGAHFAFNGLFQGSGQTPTGLRINAFTVFAFQIPLSFLLGPGLGYGAFGIWLAFPASYVLKVGLEVLAYRREGWARVGLHAS